MPLNFLKLHVFPIPKHCSSSEKLALVVSQPSGELCEPLAGCSRVVVVVRMAEAQVEDSVGGGGEQGGEAKEEEEGDRAFEVSRRL